MSAVIKFKPATTMRNSSAKPMVCREKLTTRSSSLGFSSSGMPQEVIIFIVVSAKTVRKRMFGLMLARDLLLKMRALAK